MALDNLEEVLRKADFSLSDIVRMTIYTTDMNKLISAYEPTVIRLSHAKCRPAMTILEVSRLAFSELMVEIEATAIQ
jgi:enamine deaminase RidA (YjgF/YER057c/UK114 family)